MRTSVVAHVLGSGSGLPPRLELAAHTSQRGAAGGAFAFRTYDQEKRYISGTEIFSSHRVFSGSRSIFFTLVLRPGPRTAGGPMTDGMEFGLLGPLLVRRGETIVKIPHGKRQIVLVALLLKANQFVTADALIEALWGASAAGNEKKAEGTVRTYIHKLRRALGHEGSRITTSPYGYLIQVVDGELDISRFEPLIKAAQSAARAGSWEDAQARADAALALWRGEPLTGVESASLQQEILAYRLSDLRADALQVRMDADLRLGRDVSLTELGGLIAVYSLREYFHARLMFALEQSGENAEAQVAYRQARRTIMAETRGSNYDPGPVLNDLVEKMRRAVPPAPASLRPQDLGLDERSVLAAQLSMPDAAQAGPAGPRHAKSAPPVTPSSIAVPDIRRHFRLAVALAIAVVVAAAGYAWLVLARAPSVWFKASKLPGYSRPEFCQSSVDLQPCINAIGGNTSTGSMVQVWAYGKTGDAGSLFVAKLVGKGIVTKNWPFDDPTLDEKYMNEGWQVVQFEAAPDAKPNGQCLSASEANAEISAGGGHYTPVTFMPCDGVSDLNDTWALWNSGGAHGRVIIMVGATDNTRITQVLSCLGQDGATSQCMTGSLLVAAVQGPKWAHFEPWSLNNSG